QRSVRVAIVQVGFQLLAVHYQSRTHHGGAALVMGNPSIVAVYQIRSSHHREDGRDRSAWLRGLSFIAASLIVVLIGGLVGELAHHFSVRFKNLPRTVDVDAIGFDTVDALPYHRVAFVVQLLVLL